MTTARRACAHWAVVAVLGCGPAGEALPPPDGGPHAPDGAVVAAADARVEADAPAPADAAPGARDAANPEARGASRPIDILFMIDNSASMAEEQDNLAKNFPALIRVLEQLPGGLPDVHIGIISSDVGAGPGAISTCLPAGDRGILQVKPGCGLDASARFLASDGKTSNFQGELSEVFACLARLGTMGCGYEHQLQSVRFALAEQVVPENRGFLRPEAALAVILVTDEDDCSADLATNLFVRDFPGTAASFRCAQVGHVCNGAPPPIGELDVPLAQCRAADAGALIKVSELVAALRALKPQPERQIMVAGIFGWPDDPAAARYVYPETRRARSTISPPAGPRTARPRPRSGSRPSWRPFRTACSRASARTTSRR